MIKGAEIKRKLSEISGQYQMAKKKVRIKSSS
jgi:hypothetical protein